MTLAAHLPSLGAGIWICSPLEELHARRTNVRKVSEKGAVSIYGMGRFPVTLYKEQWLKLLDMAAEIRNFIAENDAHLKAKE